MGVYLVTGVASGMGKATANQLRWQGHRVIGVDLHHADITADLSTPEGRAHVIESATKLSNGRLEGAVLAAGLGPIPGREEIIANVNYLGSVELLEGIRPLLAEGIDSKVVVFSSNSTTTVPGIPPELIEAFHDRDMDNVLKIASASPNPATLVYASSKTALAHWVRSTATTMEWAGAGIRLNAIAPGAIRTAMVEKQLAIPETAQAVLDFPVPVGGFGNPDDVAQWVIFMLSPAANFLCGSVIILDGGTDAWFRANDYPGPIPADQIGQYKERLEEYRAFREERDSK